MLQKGLLEIFALAALWGPSFLFIKVATRDIAPFTLVSLRVGLAALLLYVVLKIKNFRLSRNPRLWGHCFILGFFANGFPFVCFSYSLIHIPSSLSALINGTVPVLTVLLANLFLEDERLTWNRAVGVMLGLSGFLVLFFPLILNTETEIAVRGLGILLSFLGTCSYAVGIVYAKKYVKKEEPLGVSVLQLATTLSYLIPLACFVEAPLEWAEIALSSWAAVLGLAVLGTMLACILYYRIIARYGATALSMVTYLLPLFGTVLGVVFLKETITLYFYLAGFLILCGILVLNGVISLPIRITAISR